MSEYTITTPGTYRYQSFWSNGVPQDIQREASTSAFYHRDRKTDRKRDRKPSGWKYPKPYERFINTIRYPRGTAKIRQYGSSVYTIREGYGAGDSGLTIFSESKFNNQESLESRAIVSALSKLKSQDINLGVALGEYSETAKLVGDTAFKIARIAKAVRKGDVKKLRHELRLPSYKAAPKTWLGLQYAVVPLLSDIHGAATALQRYTYDDWVVTVKGVVNDDVYDYRVDTFTGGSKHNTTGKMGAFVRLDYMPGNVFLSTLSQLGVTNPAEIAWELVPFSFVLDWALPIGDWLSSLDAAMGYTFLSGSCTIRRDLYRAISAPPAYSDSERRFLGGSYEGYERLFTLNRKVYEKSPLPRFPTPKSPLSLGHMANGLSLLAAVLGGKHR